MVVHRAMQVDLRVQVEQEDLEVTCTLDIPALPTLLRVTEE